MTYLIDFDQTYDLIADYTVPNYGLAGGELRVILVQRFDRGYIERMSVEHFTRCQAMK